MSKASHSAELRAEREYIAFLYRRLEDERTGATRELTDVLRDSSDNHTEARWQREVAAGSITGRVGRLRVADHGLCFGRLDYVEGGHQHIGRIGLFDEEADYEPLLMDWRAPAARPFYCATAANPEGVTRRRHFHTHGQAVVDFHDDHLDGGDQDGDTALLAALNAPRGETMRDIVATIQAEQDEAIRLEHHGAVVIEGAPGTGKTAVALHRVAYLLYTRRERLARSGVLIVGPNSGFLSYIGEVVPSLGETAVVFATPGELFPGVATAVREPSPEADRVKGSASMVDVLAAAVELPESVRSNGIQPWAERVAPDELAEAVVAVRREFAECEGSVVVVAPPGTAPDGPVLTPGETKGLEFDAVLLVEPQWFDGSSELYVALTRATQRLGVLHTEPLPSFLTGLADRPGRIAVPTRG